MTIHNVNDNSEMKIVTTYKLVRLENVDNDNETMTMTNQGEPEGKMNQPVGMWGGENVDNDNNNDNDTMTVINPKRRLSQRKNLSACGEGKMLTITMTETIKQGPAS